jgi:hypothetical protein
LPVLTKPWKPFALRFAKNNRVETHRPATLLSLFTSGSTLICCALPALLVSIGSGATLVSLVSHVPQLVWMSENKLMLFVVAGVMLALAGWLQWRARFLPCPIDPELARQCTKTRVQSRRVYLFSVLIYLVGFVFAFVLPLINDQAT